MIINDHPGLAEILALDRSQEVEGKISNYENKNCVVVTLASMLRWIWPNLVSQI